MPYRLHCRDSGVYKAYVQKYMPCKHNDVTSGTYTQTTVSFLNTVERLKITTQNNALVF